MSRISVVAAAMPDFVRRLSLVLSGLALLAALMAGPASAGVDEADDLCAASDDPCVISSKFNVDSGVTLDFGTRDVEIAGSGRLSLDGGSVTILCGDFAATGGQKIALKLSGSAGGGYLTLKARRGCSHDPSTACIANSDCTGSATCSVGTGSVSLNGKIVGQDAWPGSLTIQAADDVTFSRAVNLSGTDPDSDGGDIDVYSEFGSVTINGKFDLTSGGEGTGGTLTVMAGADFNIYAEIDARGGDFDGGSLDVTAGGDVVIDADIKVNSRAGDGDGGDVDILADGDILIGADDITEVLIDDDGLGAVDGGGSGGDLTFEADGDIVVGKNAVMECNGASTDGEGGFVDLTAEGDIRIAGTIEARGKGAEGSGGEITLTATGDINVESTGTLTATAKDLGGDISLSPTGNLVFAGAAMASGLGSGEGGDLYLDVGTDAFISGSFTSTGSPPGEVDVSACRVTLSSGASVKTTGGEGGNLFTIGESMTVASGASVTADPDEGANTIVYRDADKLPVISGTVSPAATLTVNAAITGCPVCGNSEVDYGETCDDGATVDGDDCNSVCQHESCVAQTPGYPGVSLCDDGDACTNDSCGRSSRACSNVIDCTISGCSGHAQCINTTTTVTTTSTTTTTTSTTTTLAPGATTTTVVTPTTSSTTSSSSTSTTTTTTTTSSTSTTTLPAASGDQCPDTAIVEFFAASGPACTSDEDCGPGSCEGGYCRATTRLDTGTTGIYHGSDINGGSSLAVALDCAENFPCGDCAIEGIEASARTNCRCAANSRQPCDRALKNDHNDCGAYSDRTCNCYLGPPLPLSAGLTPVCVINRLAGEVSGSANVDLGELTVELSLRSLTYLAESMVTEPCPYCAGDTTGGDGLRDGTCVGGANAGQSCDGGAFNASFPAPGGGSHSLDCMPTTGKNISGDGLRISFEQSTGLSQLGHGLSCGFPYFGQSCACRTCSYDNSIPCSTTSECSALFAGSCNSLGTGINSGANACDGYACQATEADSTVAECASGPNDMFCDAVLRADGEGFLPCQSDSDCSESNLGVDAGSCGLSRRRACFLETIAAQGQADPYGPVLGAAFCAPPTANMGINGVFGLPGPVRAVIQSSLELRCANDGGKQYLPARGGCVGEPLPSATTTTTTTTTTLPACASASSPTCDGTCPEGQECEDDSGTCGCVTPTTTLPGASVSTTTTTTTTMAGPVQAGTYDLTFRLEDSVTFAALGLSIDYSSAAGGFDGTGDSVECELSSEASNVVMATFNDQESSSIVAIALIALTGQVGPVDLFACSFTTTGDFAADGSDLLITVDDATDNDSEAITPLPTVSMVPLEEGTCGDVNGDDSIKATDALLILKAAVGLPVELVCTSSFPVCGDVNADGKVMATDALLVLKAAVGLSVTLDCG